MTTRKATTVMLETAREQAGLSVDVLWIRYFGNGGTATFETFQVYLSGDVVPNKLQYNIAASTLNECFADMDLDHPVPYADGGGQGHPRP